jgi:Xaa-Pro aminopeptidase
VTASPAIPVARHAQRLDRAREVARERGVHALLVGFGADLRYLTGHTVTPLERLTVLVVSGTGPATLVVPRLEAMAAQATAAARAGLFEVQPWNETEDAAGLAARLVAASAAGGRLRPGTRIAVSAQLWAMHLLALQAAMPEASFGLTGEVLRELRMTKDPEEVQLLRAASRAADRVVDEVAAGRLVGRTEAEVSREVRDRLVDAGHDQADFAIVGSGPNSASPHHEASGRVIQPGEPIVLDIGGTMGGYCSDTTRTLWVTGGDPARGPDAEFGRLYALVHEAQAAGRAAVRPGVACEAVDAAARDVIAAGGYGPQFIHRLGHGIGLETHEEPYLVAGNREPLRAGSAFSVEPGIYIEGRYGARLEDIVVCGSDRAIVLNESSRELRIVSG